MAEFHHMPVEYWCLRCESVDETPPAFQLAMKGNKRCGREIQDYDQQLPVRGGNCTQTDRKLQQKTMWSTSIKIHNKQLKSWEFLTILVVYCEILLKWSKGDISHNPRSTANFGFAFVLKTLKLTMAVTEDQSVVIGLLALLHLMNWKGGKRDMRNLLFRTLLIEKQENTIKHPRPWCKSASFSIVVVDSQWRMLQFEDRPPMCRRQQCEVEAGGNNTPTL